MADLEGQTDRGDANRELQQGAQAGSSTPPAPGLASYAHLWSPAHFSKIIIKRDRRADAKRPDSGTQDLQKCQAMPEASWKAKDFFFSSFDKDTEFWGQGLGCCVPGELIFTRAITHGDASNSA